MHWRQLPCVSNSMASMASNILLHYRSAIGCLFSFNPVTSLVPVLLILSICFIIYMDGSYSNTMLHLVFLAKCYSELPLP